MTKTVVVWEWLIIVGGVTIIAGNLTAFATGYPATWLMLGNLILWASNVTSAALYLAFIGRDK